MSELRRASDFPDDGSPKSVPLFQEELEALYERIGQLPSDLSGFLYRVIIATASGVRSSAPGDQALLPTVTIEQVKSVAFLTASFTVSDGSIDLDGEDARCFRIIFSGNMELQGVTLSNFAADDYEQVVLRLEQDATGGRTIAGASSVSDLFDLNSHDFGGVEILMPPSPGAWVQIAGVRWSSTEKFFWQEQRRSE